MFVRQGEYSQGPLVGHRVPAEHLLFESRLSDRDLPWLADHRVHHAAIMPAAGYMELILEALGGVPLYFEVLEFLQPCPVPRTPVRLQTALQPVASTADEFTFTISSRSYDAKSKSELHCRGKVRLAGADRVAGVPERLADIDATRFGSSYLADERDFYERLEAVLSETFQYGPFFRTIRRVRADPISGAYLFDVEMDEGLWTTGREEGYVACPPLLDGGLQIFLYHLLTAADLFAIPQRAERMTFLRPPSGPRITCHVTKPGDDWMNANERGQYSVRRGERSGGSISFYDGDTGELVAHIGDYTYFTSNPRWNDLPNSKHRIAWQPKFVPAGSLLTDRLPEGEMEPAAIIAALERPERDVTRYALSRRRAGRRPRAGSHDPRGLHRLHLRARRADRVLARGRHRGSRPSLLRRVPSARRRPALRERRSFREPCSASRIAARGRRRDRFPAWGRRLARAGAMGPGAPVGGAGGPAAGPARRGRRGRAAPRMGNGSCGTGNDSAAGVARRCGHARQR